MSFEEQIQCNVQGQISGYIFAPNGGYCLYYPSNIFHNTCSFKNWEISSDIPQFWLGNIWSRDAFRPIACEQKYLMDYNAHKRRISQEEGSHTCTTSRENPLLWTLECNLYKGDNNKKILHVFLQPFHKL